MGPHRPIMGERRGERNCQRRQLWRRRLLEEGDGPASWLAAKSGRKLCWRQAHEWLRASKRLLTDIQPSPATLPEQGRAWSRPRKHGCQGRTPSCPTPANPASRRASRSGPNGRHAASRMSGRHQATPRRRTLRPPQRACGAGESRRKGMVERTIGGWVRARKRREREGKKNRREGRFFCCYTQGGLATEETHEEGGAALETMQRGYGGLATPSPWVSDGPRALRSVNSV